MPSCILALDLGGTKCAGAVIVNGEIHVREVTLIHKAKGSEIFDRIQSLREELENKAGDLEIKGLGVSVPGIYNSHDGTVWAPNLPGWNKYPLLDQLLAMNDSYAVMIESDRSCAIHGEVWQGVGKGYSNAIYMAVGTGIGAGIMMDGRVLTGAHNIAGAVGWLALDSDFKDPGYFTFGCFEYNASGDGVVRVARDMMQQYPALESRLRKGNIRASDVIKEYHEGDPLATKVMEHVITYWGKGVANLISIFNPEVIIMGGGMFGPAASFISAIKEEARKWAQPIAMEKCEIRASKLGNDALLYGAAKLVLAHEL